MYSYLIKRMGLMIPTLIGVMTIFFVITEFVPGGPLDMIYAKLRGDNQLGGKGEVARSSSTTMDRLKMKGLGFDPKDEAIFKRKFGYNHPFIKRYLRTMLWFEQDSLISDKEIPNNQEEKIFVGTQPYLVVRNDLATNKTGKELADSISSSKDLKFYLFRNDYLILDNPDKKQSEVYAYVDKSENSVKSLQDHSVLGQLIDMRNPRRTQLNYGIWTSLLVGGVLMMIGTWLSSQKNPLWRTILTVFSSAFLSFATIGFIENTIISAGFIFFIVMIASFMVADDYKGWGVVSAMIMAIIAFSIYFPIENWMLEADRQMNQKIFDGVSYTNEKGEIQKAHSAELAYQRKTGKLRLGNAQFELSGQQLGGKNQLLVVPSQVLKKSYMDVRVNQSGEKEKYLNESMELYVKQSTGTAFCDWNNWHGYFLLKFPDSSQYSKPSYKVIAEKLPLSARLGVITFFLTYLICITLGIAKAVHDGGRFDFASSILIMVGYSIPGFVLAIFLLQCFGPASPLICEIIPASGLHSDGYEAMSAFEKMKDEFFHLLAPIICLTIGSFATLTMLTKNSILEHTHQLYAVAARARGLSERAVLFKHILRNSLIPLVTGFPSSFLFMFFGGSVLIETTFNLDGIGLLGFNALRQSDFTLLMSNLFVFTILGLFGRLLTDIAYVVVDPRISFETSKSS